MPKWERAADLQDHRDGPRLRRRLPGGRGLCGRLLRRWRQDRPDHRRQGALCRAPAGHRGPADRDADGPSGPPGRRGRRLAGQRSGADQPPRARARHHDPGHAAADDGARGGDGPDQRRYRGAAREAQGAIGGDYRIALSGTADKLRATWKRAAFQPPAGGAHHLPAARRALRVLALPAGGDPERAARSGRRLPGPLDPQPASSTSRSTY